MATTILTFVFFVSAAAIAHSYFGYYIFLTLLAAAGRRKAAGAISSANSDLPGVSVVIAAANEEKNIENRIANILRCDYPREKLEIIVASDGSTDRTVEIANNFGDKRIRLLEHPDRRGRAITHNDAISFAQNPIVVFTDAETEFDKDFLRLSCAHFSDPKIGCVVGRISFKNTHDNPITQSEGFYWRYELAIRALESRTGMLATGTGACMAVRRDLFRPLAPSDDVDFITPIDCVEQGRFVIYEPKAVAFDVLPAESVARQKQVRIRMTSKNFAGTMRRLKLQLLLKRPMIFFSLMSHKILRWTSPVFALLMLVSSAALSASGERWAVFMLAIQISFYIFSAIGSFKPNVAIFRLCHSFFFVNYCFMLGVMKGILKRQPTTY